MPNDNDPMSVGLGPDGMLGMPDNPQVAEDPYVSAVGDLTKFRHMLTNPEFKRLAEKFESEADRTLRGIMQLPVITIGDLLQREQLFGEWRGLKRLAAEVEDREVELVDKHDILKSKQEQQTQ